jgi:hypothetical protein
MKHYYFLPFTDIVCSLRKVQVSPSAVHCTVGEDGMRRLPQNALEVQPAAAKQDASAAEEEIPR